MIALVVALMLAAPDAPPPAAAAPPPERPPASTDKAVDANGVPAWATRKRRRLVQNCPATRPNIGVETWRQSYDPQGTTILKPRPPQTTCHR